MPCAKYELARLYHLRTVATTIESHGLVADLRLWRCPRQSQNCDLGGERVNQLRLNVGYQISSKQKEKFARKLLPKFWLSCSSETFNEGHDLSDWH